MFPPMCNIAECKICVYTDAALANLSDGCSRMRAHIILLISPNKNCCVLNWKANKIKCVVRSTFAAETLSLEEVVADGI